ncbi:MAG: hypothetical protein OMM_04695 [Candidatus Magnetoglobus multicellularis str. Araruama]|uniref:Fibronectin type-III domain-containing protein n=1 Tax=Candidatus Magnetoglobus multicellularis str. Araruama TaxID=890399 RepID=A0A1V1P015_9BACT|nr:MAG: hypothetical protein OMM_04695 [Candidatus Magnetoglobus multicellularis str. Araruama]
MSDKATNASVALKADKADVYTINQLYTKTEIDTQMADKANNNTSVWNLSSDTSLDSSYQGIILVSGNTTLSLPDPANLTGITYTIKKIDTTSDVISISGTIDGTINPQILYPYAFMTIVSSGVTWYKIAEYMTTQDVVSPSAGNTGQLSISDEQGITVTVNWTSAIDDMTQQTEIQYVVCFATNSSDIDTIIECENNSYDDYTTGINTKDFTGLSNGITYYFNVIAKDRAENKTLFSLISVTPDSTPPTVGGNGDIYTDTVTTDSIALTWVTATDTVTSNANLNYQVYSSTITLANTIEAWEGNATAYGGWRTNTDTVTFTDLNEYTQYFFTVIVKDDAQNKTIYNPISLYTLDGLPVVGNSGTINTSNVTSESVELSWSLASDTITSQANLQYIVYFNTSTLPDTVGDWEASATAFGGWIANTNTVVVSGLSDYTDYSFNVIVKDEAANKVIYSSASIKTLDGTPPTVGNSGTLSTSGITFDSITLSWTQATDTITLASNLQYQVYTSLTLLSNTVENWETNATPYGTWTPNISSTSITGLESDTDYYLNIIVKDEAGNKSVYQYLSATTLTEPVCSNCNPQSKDSQYGAFEYNSNIYMVLSNSGTKLFKIQSNGTIDDTFGTGGGLSYPSGVSSMSFRECGSKVFGLAWNSTASRYQIYKFDDSGSGSFTLVATNNTLTTFGNGPQELSYMNGYLYVAFIDNASPTTGTGIMKFNTSTESIEIDIQVYGGTQVYYIMQDTSGQLWIKKGSQQVKVDSSLNVITGGEKNISLSRFYRIESPSEMLYVAGSANDTVLVYYGSVDNFLVDADDGTLNGPYTYQITVHNGEAKYPTPYGARVLGNTLLVYTYLSTGSTPAYKHYIGMYDLPTNTVIGSFNSGAPLLLDTSYYSNYYHRAYIHIFKSSSQLNYSYRKNNGDTVLNE